MKFSTIAILIIASALSEHCNGKRCYPVDYALVTDYDIDPNRETPQGIPVDTRKLDEGVEVDLEKIDDIVFETVGCLEELGYDVDLSCLELRVAGDWYWAHDDINQVFPCEIDESLCTEKVITGQLPALNLRCACRATIQGDAIIIPPNLGLLRSELVRLFTGVNNVWAVEELKECVDHETPE
jgi:hypothetical protein